MGSTFVSLYYHVVFGTKNREAFITSVWRTRFHEYLGGTIHGLGGVSEQVGGTGDHVHLLIGLKASHSLADVVRELKTASSGWIHEELSIRGFAWQQGYAAFTVSATARSSVIKYIANQEEHHRVESFRDEYFELLKKAGIAYDPSYLD